MAEIKQNTIGQVLAYREHVPRSGRVLESFLGYSDQLLFINKCYSSCFSSMFVFEAWLIQCFILRRLQIQYLHPKQILIRRSRLHKRDIPSAAFAWGKAPVWCTIWPIFTSDADFFTLLIAFKNQSLLPRTKISNVTQASHLCWSENHTSFSWAKTVIFPVNSAIFGIKRNLRNQAFYLC